MTERPIIFNDAMSRAILSGAKTETRRPIVAANGDANEPYAFSRAVPGGALFSLREGRYTVECKHSFGVPGDTLWVREAWSLPPSALSIYYREGGARLLSSRDASANMESVNAWVKKLSRVAGLSVWAPSIHMPRWAARTVLDVLEVRVERLQDITGDGARAEGFTSRVAFINTWNEIYPAMAFEADPWVWVVRFKRQGGE